MSTAIYLRQSLDVTGDRLAVTRQREDNVALAERKGWGDIVEYEDNDTSASKGVRPAYQRMLKDIESGKVDAVIAWDLDRLHRQPRELEDFIDLCDRQRVKLATVGGDTDLSTDQGRLTARIKGAVARAEIERKSARQKRQHLQRAQAGKGWGPRSFGYNGNHNDPKLVPEEAKLLKQAYHDFIAGSSLASIANRWNDKGVRTPRDGTWDNSNLSRVLRNPRNAGLMEYDGEIIGKGKWPAIIDEDTYKAAQYILGGFSAVHNQHKARKYRYGSLMTCGECGTLLVSGQGSKMTGEDRPIYRCKNPKCGKVSRRQKLVDSFIKDTLVRRLQKKHLWVKQHTGLSADEIDALHEEVSTLNTRIESFAIERAEGLMTAKQVAVATAAVQAKIDAINAKLRESSASPLMQRLAETKPEDMEDVWDDIGTDQQRTVIQMLCDKIVVDTLGTKGRGAAKLPIGYGIHFHWRKPEDD